MRSVGSRVPIVWPSCLAAVVRLTHFDDFDHYRFGAENRLVIGA
jgi:hypothetical protein